MKCHVGIDIGAVSIKAALLLAEPSFPQGSGQRPPPEGGGRSNVLSALKGAGFVPAGASGDQSAAEAVGGGRVFLSPYRRTRGRPIESATELLEQVIAVVGTDVVAGLCLTGSAAELVAEKMGAGTINEFKAVARGAWGLGLHVRTVFEMGGQSSKYLLLDRTDDGYGIVDYSTNGDCAAGTGSFIDQQAGRLRYPVEDVGRIALEAQRNAQVAGRCSVFAKSDMVHAQQKGYTPAEVLAGLCNAVARNFRMAVVRSHPVEPPVAFVGGLAANAAVVRGLREAFGLSESELFVPDHFAHAGAVGAALAAAGKVESPVTADAAAIAAGWAFSEAMGRLRAASDSARRSFPTADPLSTHRLLLLRDQVAPYEMPYAPEPVDAYLGIDIGSVSTNLVVIDADGAVMKEIYVCTKGRPIEVVSQGLKDIAGELGDRVVIRGVGTTGSGRELIGELVGADTINDEITAHKTGATFIGHKMLNGRVPDTIFEIGGQDSKFISLQDGVVVDFTMNEACAAGTGSFLEERAEELDISIINEFAELALSSEAPIRLGERCTVFMERDVNDYLQRGADKQDLVAGLAYSVVYNYINRVVRGRHIGDCIFFQGGTAYNDAVAAAFAAVLDKEIIVPPHNGVIGAIGSALLARDKMLSGEDNSGFRISDFGLDGNANVNGGGEPAARRADVGTYVSERRALERRGEDAACDIRDPKSEIRNPKSEIANPKSRFRGYDLGKVRYALREFTCKGCSNQCIMQEFDVEGEKTYWGDKCSDRYRKRKKSPVKPVIDDIFAAREELLNDSSALPEPPDGAATVGIPRAMFAMDYLPFWRAFWAGCGFRTVVSDPTNRQTAALGTSHVVAEPCFPVIVAHGHVAQLIETGADWVFMPNTVSAVTDWMERESFICPWGQTLPFVLRRVPEFEKHIGKFVSPSIRFRDGRKAVRAALRKTVRPMGVSKAAADAAVDAAYEAQEKFRSALLAHGRRAMATLQRTAAPAIVIVGRPYNVHDAGVNLNVARKLRDYYGVNCLPIDCLDTDPVDVRDVNENMYWAYGRRILAAARIVGEHPNLHIIQISNFKCGPDSFIKHFIRTASGKPFLSLQFDGHSNDAGMMTRCEAYLDSKGILRPWRKASSDQDAAVLSTG